MAAIIVFAFVLVVVVSSLVVVVVRPNSNTALPTWARTESAVQNNVTNKKLNIIKHKIRVSVQFALERADNVCFTSCCRNTVPHNWPGHREGSVAKFRSCTRNRVVGAGR